MIKFLFSLILVLFIFFLIYIIKHLKYRESFEIYQRLSYNDNGETIGPNTYLKYTPLIVYQNRSPEKKSFQVCGDNSHQNQIIIQTINNFFPLKGFFFEEYQYKSNYILKRVSENKSSFGIIDETSLQISLEKIRSNKKNIVYNTRFNILSEYSEFKYYPNIRFVGALYNKSLTFICKLNQNILSSYKMVNLTIGCVKDSVDYIKLQFFLQANDNYTNTIIFFNDIKSLFTAFEKNKIKILYLCCAHPSPYIVDISKREKIRIIDCQGDFSNKKIKYLMPLVKKEKINMSVYGLNEMVNCLSFRTLLISNSKVDKESVYKLLYNFFINFNFVNSQTKFIFEKYLNKMYVYYVNKKIQYHEGAKIFYKNQGLMLDSIIV